MEYTLFIGNGINMLETTCSWKGLLVQLSEFVEKDKIILKMIKEKPFTLVFEEIYLRSARFNNVSELMLKEEVARIINEIPENKHHRRIIDLNIKNIITTNYDYNIEDSSGKKFTNSSLLKERKYSLYRKNSSEDINVWHIHGEYSLPNSISLGHDHLSGSLHNIRDYLVTKSKRSKKKASPFLAKDLIFDKNSNDYSWLDIFLRDDIIIYGFSMDYTEIELWWLLSFKERLRLEDYPVGNTYFSYHEDIKDEMEDKQKAKRSLLKSFGVKLIPLSGSNYPEAFEYFIGQMSSQYNIEESTN